MTQKEVETFTPKSRADWREWLQKNHLTKPAVWLILYKKGSDAPTISWSECVDEALCFGWIDGKRISLDDERFMQFVCKRKPYGTWSKINKQKVGQLTASGLMAPAGLAAIELAKQNGSWSLLDEVEELKIPEDLERAFDQHRGAKAYFLLLSKSVKKAMLQWIMFAKRPETRQNRIAEIATLAAKKQRPKQFGGS